MATFQNQAAQGDLLLIRIDTLPGDATATEPSAVVVLAHSETGHHHAISAPPGAVELFGSGTPLLAYLRVNRDAVELKHHRTFDTHETLNISRGIYEVRRQREWSPEGWRRVED